MSFFFYPFISFKQNVAIVPKPTKRIPPLCNLTGPANVIDGEMFFISSGYNAFNEGGAYLTHGTYSGDTGLPTLRPYTYVGDTPYPGISITLSLPWQAKLSASTFLQTTYNQNASPKSWVILGSLDGAEWQILGSCNNCLHYGNAVITTSLNSNIPVQYVRHLATQNYGNGDVGLYWWSLNYYGTEESKISVGRRYPSSELFYPTFENPTHTVPEGTYTFSYSSQAGGNTPVVSLYYNGKSAMSGFHYNTFGNYIGSVSTNIVDSTPINGEWFQFNLPKQIQLRALFIVNPYGNTPQLSAIRKFAIVASNDGTNWTVLYRKANFSYNGQGMTNKLYINAGDAYSSYRIIIEEIYGYNGSGFGDGDSLALLGMVYFYSFEKELTPPLRTLPTGTMTSTSNVFGGEVYTIGSWNSNVPDTIYNSFTNTGWTAGTYNPSTGVSTELSLPSARSKIMHPDGYLYTDPLYGNWVSMQLPKPSKITSFKFTQTTATQSPVDVRVDGSMDGAYWWSFGGSNNIPFYGTNTEVTIPNTLTDTYVKYMRFTVTKNGGNATTIFKNIKFIGYTYDDYIYGNEYPSVSLQNSLVAPEGTYAISSSSEGIRSARTSFYKNPTMRGFVSAPMYTSAGALKPGGGYSIIPGGDAFSGEWIQIDLPISIKLTAISITCANDIAQNMKNICITGSPNNVFWVFLTAVRDVDYIGQGMTYKFAVFSSTAYSRYRIIIPTVWGNQYTPSADDTAVAMGDIRLYGIPA